MYTCLSVERVVSLHLTPRSNTIFRNHKCALQHGNDQRNIGTVSFVWYTVESSTTEGLLDTASDAVRFVQVERTASKQSEVEGVNHLTYRSSGC